MKLKHYDIRIEPDFSEFSFTGSVRLIIVADEPVDEVTLNAHELELHNCVLLHDDSLKDCKNTLRPDHQEAIIHLPQAVSGEFGLEIEYSGKINDQYAGLYRSKYSHDGRECYIASTQFEAKDARRAFPCFDQPGKKATFDIEYVIDNSLTGISNTLIKDEIQLDEGKKLVRFERTPKMSTYLVFFGIGEFEFIEDSTEEPLIRVATTPGKKEFGKFALDIARKSLRFGEEYTGIPYPMAKCDYIAIPDSMGAMENFGAIRHSEDDLLVYPGVTSKTRSVLTAKIIAHEGIHMWFGDLVSPAAWKYLWLNESFATYFTYVIPDYFFPEWGVWDQFFSERLLTGMERDSLAGTISIDLPNVDDPDADPAPTPSTAPIVYNKGAAAIRMLAAFLGEKRFKKGLHEFLDEYQFEAATSDQFWAAIETSSGEPLGKFAETWIHQPGYPLVDVQQKGQTLSLRQERFGYFNEESSNQTWVIPIDIILFLKDGSTESIQIVLDEIDGSVPVPENCVGYKLNAGYTGFYRVRYPNENLNKLGELIRAQTLASIDSLNVLNDLFTLVKAGEYSVFDYLNFVRHYLDKEDRYLPLIDMAKNFTYLYQVVRTRRDEISQFGNAIFERNLEAIGYQPDEEESLLMTELRTALLSAGLTLQSQRVIEFGVSQFQNLLDEVPVHRDIYSPVLKIAANAHPVAKSWLTERALDISLPEGERKLALEALGYLSQEDDLKHALGLNLEKVPQSSRHHMLGEAAYNPDTFEWLWPWFSENLAEIEKLPPSYVQGIFVRLAPLSGIGYQGEVKSCAGDFVSRHPATADSIDMALEFLAVNERLASNSLGEI